MARGKRNVSGLTDLADSHCAMLYREGIAAMRIGFDCKNNGSVHRGLRVCWLAQEVDELLGKYNGAEKRKALRLADKVYALGFARCLMDGAEALEHSYREARVNERRARQQAPYLAARAHGKRGGRKPKVTDGALRRAVERHQVTTPSAPRTRVYSDVAAELGLDARTVQRRLKGLLT